MRNYKKFHNFSSEGKYNINNEAKIIIIIIISSCFHHKLLQQELHYMDLAQEHSGSEKLSHKQVSSDAFSEVPVYCWCMKQGPSSSVMCSWDLVWSKSKTDISESKCNSSIQTSLSLHWMFFGSLDWSQASDLDIIENFFDSSQVILHA